MEMFREEILFLYQDALLDWNYAGTVLGVSGSKTIFETD